MDFFFHSYHLFIRYQFSSSDEFFNGIGLELSTLSSEERWSNYLVETSLPKTNEWLLRRESLKETERKWKKVVTDGSFLLDAAQGVMLFRAGRQHVSVGGSGGQGTEMGESVVSPPTPPRLPQGSDRIPSFLVTMLFSRSMRSVVIARNSYLKRCNLYIFLELLLHLKGENGSTQIKNTSQFEVC